MFYLTHIIRPAGRRVVVVGCVFILLGLFLTVPALAAEPDMSVMEAEAKAFGMIVPKERKLAPEFTLSDLKGRTHTFSELKGKVVFLHFWATWCKPCRIEMPMLGDLRGSLQADGLEVVTVVVDRGSAKWTGKSVGKFARKYGIDVDVLLDHNNDVRKLYDVSMLPTTYMIGRDGRFVGKMIGGRKWNSPESHRFFRAILK